MSFKSQIVRGVTLVREAIQSSNFVTGLTGWSINRDGSAEFQDIVARGDVTVDSLFASGVVGSMELEPNGPNGMPTFQFVTASTPSGSFAGITAQNSISIPGGTRLDFTSTPYDSTTDGVTRVHQLMRVGPDFSGTFILADATGEFVGGYAEVLDDRVDIGFQALTGATQHQIVANDSGIFLIANVPGVDPNTITLKASDGINMVGNSGGADNGIVIDSDGVRVNGGDVFRSSASPVYKDSFRPNVGDNTAAAMADWITAFSAIGVPTWARDGTATIKISIAVTAAIINAASTFSIRAAVGATVGDTVNFIAPAVNFQCTVVAYVELLIPAGTNNITPKLQTFRLAGTGALRATTGASNNNPLVVVDAVFMK